MKKTILTLLLFFALLTSTTFEVLLLWVVGITVVWLILVIASLRPPRPPMVPV